ncbi:hypothetical protein [Thauera sp.]|nr:hypothetical protein [Thauera sp.]HRP25664.1 hypothetical protein [Thauera sp.]
MTTKENAPATTEAQSENNGLDSTARGTPRTDLLAAFALAGWLSEATR